MEILEVKYSKVKDESFQKLFPKQILSTWQFLTRFLKDIPMYEQQGIPEFSTLLSRGSSSLLL